MCALLVEHSAEGRSEGYQNDIVLVGAGEVRASGVEHADDLEWDLPDEDPATHCRFLAGRLRHYAEMLEEAPGDTS